MARRSNAECWRLGASEKELHADPVSIAAFCAATPPDLHDDGDRHRDAGNRDQASRQMRHLHRLASQEAEPPRADILKLPEEGAGVFGGSSEGWKQPTLDLANERGTRVSPLLRSTLFHSTISLPQ